MGALVSIGMWGVMMFLGWRIGVWLESSAWNNGKCSRCHKPWVYFDTDSQGGRGYKCGCGNCCWVSWWGIDS